MPTFTTRVLSVVRRIPVGRVATYGDVAAAAGSPRAARAVGNIMRTCGGRTCPAHRVVAAAGRLGGYGGNLELKRALLRAEGLHVTRTRPFAISRPVDSLDLALARRRPARASRDIKGRNPASQGQPFERADYARRVRATLNPAWLRLR